MSRSLRAVVADALVVAGCIAGMCAFGVAVVSGGSMRPALAPGDIVVYARSHANVRPGTMVLLGRRGHRYVHRVVTLERGGTMVTRGDANPIPDRDETSVAAVRGRVLAVVPSGRLLGRLASSAR